MYAETLGRFLADAEQLAAMKVKGADAATIMAKAKASAAIPLYEAALFPADDDE